METKKLLTILLCGALLSGLNAQEKQIDKTFSGVKRIRISTSSGDVYVKKGSGSDVRVQLDYDEEDMEPEIEQNGETLRLSEERDRGWGGRWNNRRNSRTKWTLTVPENLRYDFNTASGNFEIINVKAEEIEGNTASGDLLIENTGKAEIDVNTASGDLTISNNEGNISANTASGDVKITDANGEIKLNTASGDVRVRKVTGRFDINTASGNATVESAKITGRSKFNTASGDVSVSLSGDLTADLEISTASGDGTLDLNGSKLDAYVEMVARANRNRIRAPFDFDDEKTFRKWGNEYERKTKKLGSAKNQVIIETASGRISINK
ncbi:MAG: DUF4097 family beta strand repeat protein [Calditrichaeota bacterium]|nr:DUF4097 family beta strand repeat protein [Calditrichota bacterium]